MDKRRVLLWRTAPPCAAAILAASDAAITSPPRSGILDRTSQRACGEAEHGGVVRNHHEPEPALVPRPLGRPPRRRPPCRTGYRCRRVAASTPAMSWSFSGSFAGRPLDSARSPVPMNTADSPSTATISSIARSAACSSSCTPRTTPESPPPGSRAPVSSPHRPGARRPAHARARRRARSASLPPPRDTSRRRRRAAPATRRRPSRAAAAHGSRTGRAHGRARPCPSPAPPRSPRTRSAASSGACSMSTTTKSNPAWPSNSTVSRAGILTHVPNSVGPSPAKRSANVPNVLHGASHGPRRARSRREPGVRP